MSKDKTKEITLSDGREIKVREIKFLDFGDISEGNTNREIMRNMIHVATKMPNEEIEALGIEDGKLIQETIREVNPGLEAENFTEKTSDKNG